LRTIAVKKVKVLKVKYANGTIARMTMNMNTEAGAPISNDKNVTSISHLPPFSFGAPTYLGPHNGDVSKDRITFVDEEDGKTYISCQVDCYSSFDLNNQTRFFFKVDNPNSFRYYNYWATAKQGCYSADKVKQSQRMLILEACENYGNNTVNANLKFNKEDVKQAFATVRGRNTYKPLNPRLPLAYRQTVKARPLFDAHHSKNGNTVLFSICRMARRVGGAVVNVVRKVVGHITRRFKDRKARTLARRAKKAGLAQSKALKKPNNQGKPRSAAHANKVNKKASNQGKPASKKVIVVTRKTTQNKVVKKVDNQGKPKSSIKKATILPKKK
jgi:hypothetical protein